MAYEMKEGDVSVFPNNKTKDSQPDYTGTALINGQKMRVALWLKEGKSKFLAGKIQPDQQQEAEYKTVSPEVTGSDNLPF